MNVFSKNGILFFIVIELILLIICIILFFKITRGMVKGVQNTEVIKKESVIFDNSQKLKYFFEPKPNTIDVQNPFWLGYTSKSKINSDSLNSDTDYAIKSDEGTYRIVTLGDSFTYGLFVNTADTWPKLLESRLNRLKCSNIKRFEILNFGVSGYDVEYTVTRFAKRGIKYNPNLVIVLLNNWNFDKINELWSPVYEKLQLSGIPGYVPNLGKQINYSKTMEEVFAKYGQEYISNYQRKALFRLHDFYNGKLIMTSFPTLLDKYKRIVEDFIKLEPQNSFTVNLTDTVGSDGLHFKDDMHPNREGHRQIAEDLYNFLIKNLLTGCRT